MEHEIQIPFPVISNMSLQVSKLTSIESTTTDCNGADLTTEFISVNTRVKHPLMVIVGPPQFYYHHKWVLHSSINRGEGRALLMAFLWKKLCGMN
jgi:hypothetical protein